MCGFLVCFSFIPFILNWNCTKCAANRCVKSCIIHLRFRIRLILAFIHFDFHLIIYASFIVLFMIILRSNFYFGSLFAHSFALVYSVMFSIYIMGCWVYWCAISMAFASWLLKHFPFQFNTFPAECGVHLISKCNLNAFTLVNISVSVSRLLYVSRWTGSVWFILIFSLSIWNLKIAKNIFRSQNAHMHTTLIIIVLDKMDIFHITVVGCFFF